MSFLNTVFDDKPLTIYHLKFVRELTLKSIKISLMIAHYFSALQCVFTILNIDIILY